jgi:hypothetical protein
MIGVSHCKKSCYTHTLGEGVLVLETEQQEGS